LVFPSTIGTENDPSNLLKKFRQLLKKAGLPKIRFHDLRHTSASLMLNNGVDVLVASRRLGHSKPSLTLDVYGHLLTSVQYDVAEKIDKLILE
jgi:integrase